MEGAGFRVLLAADTLEGIKNLYQDYPDLIIAARELSVVNGEESFIRIRQASYLPIVVIGNQEEAAETLELGADAFMTKPPNLKELIARVRRLLQRKPDFGWREDNYGPNNNISNDANENRLNYLSATEFRLASCLILNKGKLLDYNQLIGEVWGGKEGSRDTLHSYVRRLREKIQAYFPYKINIFNYRGVGYCLEEIRP